MKITGYFSTYKNANEAAEKLRQEGFTNAFIDLNDNFNDLNTQTNQPGTESATNSLADLVLKSGDPAVSRKKAPLIAAGPMVSGMGTFDGILEVRCRVSVDVEMENAERAEEILRASGGEFEKPKVGIPQGLENVGLEEVILSNIDQV